MRLQPGSMPSFVDTVMRSRNRDFRPGESDRGHAAFLAKHTACDRRADNGPRADSDEMPQSGPRRVSCWGMPPTANVSTCGPKVIGESWVVC